MTGPVRITIDVLAVSGLDATQARAFGSALERELARLVAAHGVPHRSISPGVFPSMTLGGLAIRPDQPERAGDVVARAIYRGFVE